MVSAWGYPTPNLLSGLTPKLAKRAVATDVLGGASLPLCGFLISPLIVKFLANFRLMAHRLYDCPVSGNVPQGKGYKWLHLCDPDLVHQVDYAASSFLEDEYGLDDLGPIEITSFAHYEDLKPKDTEASFGVTLERLVFLTETPKLDMLIILPFTEILISDRLHDALEASGITGFEFEEGMEIIYA